MSLFEGIFSKLFENKYISPRNIFSDFKTKDSITGLLDKVINCKGEASALAHSETLMIKIENLNDEKLLDFFLTLSKDYDFDNQELLKSVSNYADNNSTQNYTSMTSKFNSNYNINCGNLSKHLNIAIYSNICRYNSSCGSVFV